MAIHISSVLLAAVFAVAFKTCIAVPVEASKALADPEQCNTARTIRLQNPQKAKEEFAKIDKEQVWVIFLQLIDADNASNSGNDRFRKEGLQNVVWAYKHSTPFLDFNENFEVLSFTMLSDSVAVLKIPIYWEPDACFANLTVAGLLLQNVTENRGAVCFGTRIGGGVPDEKDNVPSCCEWREETGLECEKPSSDWKLIDMDHLSMLFVIVIVLSFALLLCSLPSPPEPQDDGVELTSLLDPSPVSLTNAFVRCFSNQPESCLLKTLVRIYSRLVLFLVILLLPMYLQMHLFKITPNAKPSTFIDIANYSYCVYVPPAVICAFLPPLGCYKKMREHVDTENYLRPNITVFLKSWLTLFPYVFAEFVDIFASSQETDYFSQLLAVLTVIILAFIIVPLIVGICPLLFFLMFFVGPLFYSLRVLQYVWSVSYNYKRKVVISCFFVCLTGFFLFSYAIVLYLLAIFNVLLLEKFLRYTLIGLAVNHKTYLPVAWSISAVFYNIHRIYHSTNGMYNRLRKLLFKVCIKLQQQRDIAQKTKESESVVKTTTLTDVDVDDIPHAEPTALASTKDDSFKTKLVYNDENGSKLIQEKLFDKACSKFLPYAVMIMVFKMFIVSVVLLVTLVAVWTLVPRTELERVAQVFIAVFVAAVPSIWSVISSDGSCEELHKLDTENRLTKFVQEYKQEQTIQRPKRTDERKEQDMKLGDIQSTSNTQ